MTQQELKLLFAYNAWSLNRVFEAVAAMPAEQITKDMHASHASILGTLEHIVAVEGVWLERWLGKADAVVKKPGELPTLEKLRETWNTIGFETAKFVAGVSDRKLADLFDLKTPEGEVRKHIYWQSMMHVVDHGTFHRGQVISLMREQGVKPPPTGMIGFFRETAKLGKVQ